MSVEMRDLARYWRDLRNLGDDELVVQLHIETSPVYREAIMAELDRRNPPTWISGWMWNAIKRTVLAA